MEKRKCPRCSKIFERPKGYSEKQWLSKQTCSGSCAKIKSFNEHYIDKNIVYIKCKEQYILCDEEDLKVVSKFRWSLSNGYAINNYTKMHHLIMGKPPKGLVTDHINRNSLDNRRENLRFVTQKENCRNKKVSNKFGCAGIEHRNNSYYVHITANYKSIHVGTYKSISSAKIARGKAEKTYWAS